MGLPTQHTVVVWLSFLLFHRLAASEAHRAQCKIQDGQQTQDVVSGQTKFVLKIDRSIGWIPADNGALHDFFDNNAKLSLCSSLPVSEYCSDSNAIDLELLFFSEDTLIVNAKVDTVSLPTNDNDFDLTLSLKSSISNDVFAQQSISCGSLSLSQIHSQNDDNKEMSSGASLLGLPEMLRLDESFDSDQRGDGRVIHKTKKVHHFGRVTAFIVFTCIFAMAVIVSIVLSAEMYRDPSLDWSTFIELCKPSDRRRSSSLLTYCCDRLMENRRRAASQALVSEFDAPKLPDGWQMFTTDNGEAYYYNERTGVTQWERPFAAGASADDPFPDDGM